MSIEDQFNKNSPIKSMNIEQLFNGYYTPIADVKETKECTLVNIELPGVKNHDIIIEIGNGTLDVRGEHSEDKSHRSLPLTSIRKERIFGKFKRSVNIPYDVSSNEIRASFKDGLLTVEIPKPKQRMNHKKQKVRLN